MEYLNAVQTEVTDPGGCHQILVVGCMVVVNHSQSRLNWSMQD